MDRMTIVKLGWIAGLVALSTSAGVKAAEPTFYEGEVKYFALDFCPGFSLPADGRQLLIREYPGLFAALGTRYGGDGKTKFALPNLENPPTKTGATLKACVSWIGIAPTRPPGSR